MAHSELRKKPLVAKPLDYERAKIDWSLSPTLAEGVVPEGK